MRRKQGPTIPGRSTAGETDQRGFGFSIGLSRQINPFIFVVQGVMTYRAETTSIGGFIQQLAVSCVSKGYFFYVAGSVPPGKDPRVIDQKLIDRYGIDISKWARVAANRRDTPTFATSDSNGSSSSWPHMASIRSSRPKRPASRTFAECPSRSPATR